MLHWHSFVLLRPSRDQSQFMKCYHAETDGWDSTTFHSKCDGKGPTVSIIQVSNYTFGGHTDVSWQGMLSCQLLITHRGGGG